MSTPTERYTLAVALGRLARFQLRAEILLEHYDSHLTNGEREQLARVVAAPKEDDIVYLRQFDRLLRR